MEVRPIVTARPCLELRVLAADDVERLHGAALAYLERAGIAVPSRRARAALLAAGATAGDEGGLVRLPSDLVQELVAKAPATFALAGRIAEHDVAAGGDQVLLAAGGQATRVRTAAGEVRLPAPGDLTAACTVADYLSEVGLVCAPPVTPADGGTLAAAVRCMQATSKHLLLAGVTTTAEAEAAVAAAQAVAGSGTAARQRPPLSIISSGEALDAALVFAAAGLPAGGVVCRPAPAAPADLAAALVLAHAAALAACAALQAAAPGAPTFYVVQPRRLGWRLDTAQANLVAIAAGQLAARCCLPLVSDVFTTTSCEPDWQASTQNTFAGLSGALARAAVMTGAGLLAGGELFSCEQLVMDGELLSVAAKIAAAIEVDDETIALETIARVGIGGNYLGERHTRRHMKDVWRPRLLDRSPWDAWVAGGRQGSYDKAVDLTQKIVSEHRATPLDDAVAAELEAISATGDHGKEPA